MATTVKDMLAAANDAVPRVLPEEARRLVDEEGALVVDVRDPTETATGMVPGAVNVSRGMLEFRADPASPYHDAAFDPARPVVLYCASGGRSALGGKVLKDLGYERVYNLGGVNEWKAAGMTPGTVLGARDKT